MLAITEENDTMPQCLAQRSFDKTSPGANQRLFDHIQRAEIELSFALAEAQAINDGATIAMIEFALAAMRSSNRSQFLG